jgi:hypothetical protein
MSTWLVIAVTIAYVLTAIDLAMRKDWGHAVMFAGYAWANVGLIWAIQGG